jgi:hypothetical protein
MDKVPGDFVLFAVKVAPKDVGMKIILHLWVARVSNQSTT